MSTRSIIAIKENDKYTCIYCHWDGYLSYNGRLLEEHYQDVDKIKRLIALGDISSLGEKVEPETNTHSFGNREEGVVVAYHRDREEPFKDVAATTQYSIKQIKDHYSWCSYIYFYDVLESCWYVIIGNNSEVVLLSHALEEIEEED